MHNFIVAESTAVNYITWCGQIHVTRDVLDTFILVHTSHFGSRCLWCAFTPSSCHLMMSRVRACVVCSRFVFFLSLDCLAHQLPWRRNCRGLTPLHSRTMRSIAPWWNTILSTYYWPKLLDNFWPLRVFCNDLPGWVRRHTYGTVVLVRWRNSTMRFSEKRYFHHCSFRSEKNQRTGDSAYHSHEESLLPAQSFFAHTRTERPIYELSSCQKRKSSRDLENEMNQESPWKTWRANFRSSQNQDSEARISSRFW